MLSRHPFPRGRRATAILLPALLGLILAAGLAGAAWTTVRTVKGAKRAVAEVDGKARTYWLLEQDGTMTATVNGPAVLRVVTRAPWKGKLKGKESVVAWSLDGQPGGTWRHPLVRSQSARLRPAKDSPEFGTPDKWPRLSASRTEEIQIPYGTHKVQFKAADSAAPVLLRLKLKSLHPLPKGDTVDLLPRAAGDTRTVTVRDARSTYQVLASGKSLELDVTGPTVVKVISRLDWNSTMTGQQKYQLKVFEDDALKNTWVLRGRHSAAALYAGKDDSTPARGEVLYIEVPAGRHQYRVSFEDSGREVNLRFLLPREALRNGGK